MLKHVSLFFFIFCSFAKLSAQTDSLVFDKKVIDCENKWVAYPLKKAEKYAFGFIYLDTQAGLTINMEGFFSIVNGVFTPEKLTKTVSHKIRLKPRSRPVMIIPEPRFKELDIPEKPEWLKFYETKSDSLKHWLAWGTYLNANNESKRALNYLEKIYAVNSSYKGLPFELSYSYNALGNFEKAIPILEKVLQSEPEDCSLYKELSFAKMHLNMLEEAENVYKKMLESCHDNKQKGEVSFNLATIYHNKHDFDKTKIWLEESKQWINKDNKLYFSLLQLENLINTQTK